MYYNWLRKEHLDRPQQDYPMNSVLLSFASKSDCPILAND